MGGRAGAARRRAAQHDACAGGRGLTALSALGRPPEARATRDDLGERLCGEPARGRWPRRLRRRRRAGPALRQLHLLERCGGQPRHEQCGIGVAADCHGASDVRVGGGSGSELLDPPPDSKANSSDVNEGRSSTEGPPDSKPNSSMVFSLRLLHPPFPCFGDRR